ncbi:hypothetical protein HMPREF3185_00487 [Porphyromonas somerae]|uniref:Uncharacterized protein n=1 Tax=Porphyromonas somerae TaxID=322095 RepID=A0A134BCF0_9PORP|nr:hypothetical protein HMPREF3184_00487 [Porphyromonadaceae bacterium KA00676]KXB77605.1 hypothetical protein HMPREF3185_00487 [Porphyromonas somerae]
MKGATYGSYKFTSIRRIAGARSLCHAPLGHSTVRRERDFARRDM